MSAVAQLLIREQFNGPPGTGNGGYTAGVVASQLPDRSVEVTLRIPPPLETPLRVDRPAGGGVEVYEGTRLVAEARPVPLDDPPVPGVSYEAAVAASAAYPGFVDHPFPTCYVCGPRRDDGLRIFPGPLPDGGGTAAPWRVPADADPVTVWAALDCPGGWAIVSVSAALPGADRVRGNPAPDLAAGRPYLLGRMLAQVSAVPEPGTGCVVVGALVGTSGRKATVRTALYAPGGELLAHARSTWLAI